jgi:hypothetical protein
MLDVQVLNSLGIEPWVIRDKGLFKYYSDTQAKGALKFNIIHGNISANSVFVILPEKQPYTKVVNNLCKYLLIGYNFKVVVLQQSHEGGLLEEIAENNKPSYVISFVEIQKETSILNNNVLILNNIDFNKLENCISYKKQVLLDVLRMSIPSLGDK